MDSSFLETESADATAPGWGEVVVVTPCPSLNQHMTLLTANVGEDVYAQMRSHFARSGLIPLLEARDLTKSLLRLRDQIWHAFRS